MSETAEMLTRAAPIVGTANADKRTVEVSFASGAPVKRYSWEEGYYLEVLTISREAIRPERLDAGMSVLDSHRAEGMDNRLGSVIPGSLRIENGQAFVTLKFSRRAKADEIFRDILDGHTVPISVGYKTHRYERKTADEGELPTYQAIDWEPLEISTVPIPADHNAHTRTGEDDMSPRRTYLYKTTEEGETLQRSAETQTSNRKLGIRQRRTFIREMFQDRPDFLRDYSAEIEELITDTRGLNETQIREEVFGLIVDIQDRTPTFPIPPMRGMMESRMSRSEAMVQALIHRTDPSHAVPEQAREFVGRSIVELARSCLEAGGMSTIGENAGTIVSRALHTTSDFPALMVSYSNVTLQQSYGAIPSPLKQLGNRTIAQDFRPMTFLRLSDLPELKKVNEHGEFTRGTIGEATETYKLDTYGRIFSITRQLLINDNLGAIARGLQSWGRKAAELESKLLRQALGSNPKMNDGKALFHADHKNLGTGAALTQQALEAAVLQMRKQVDMSGEYAGVNPRFLLVPGDLEFVARRLLAEISPTTSGDVNPLAKQLTLVVDPGLSDPAAWYLVASTAEVDGLDYAYLAGQEQPFFDEHVGFNIDGVEFKLRHDFGAGFVDWRGWYKNPGQ